MQGHGFHLLAACLAASPLLLAATDVHAARPRGVVKWLPGARDSSPPEAGAAAPLVIFMNRHGGTYFPAFDNDSSTNASTIPEDVSTVGAFHLGDPEWTQLMACVRVMYGRWNVAITDEDPGAAPHLESVVGGVPGELQMPAGVGGVSPGTCGVIDRSIVFTFAAIYGDDVQEICHTVAQETAHSLGLDHELLCTDPMTYLGGCGVKRFQDEDAPCGEDVPRDCMCGGATQNSVRMLDVRLGPAELVAPVVALLAPVEGAVVASGFAIVAEATDNYVVSKVELRIDGESITSRGFAPYEFTAPQDLAPGTHTLVIVAYDFAGNTASDEVIVTVAAGCASDADCDPGASCAGGVCLGDVGSACDAPGDCAGGLCVAVGQFERICTAACDSAAADACPSGFACTVGAGSVDKCLPAPPEEGGCHVWRASGERQGERGTTTLVTGLLAGLGLALSTWRARRA
ncbi:MAG: hypothetical protein EXR73_11785 [Myxococcales bacterium]|nr:hypothetical protein [Myxococcales bacterium]